MTGAGHLAVTWHGDGSRVVLLHGFTQTGRSWRAVAGRLAERRRVGLVDLPGHGSSGEPPPSLDHAADLLAATLGTAVYIGYSLGGRHALHVAVRHPDQVPALVLLGTSPGIANDLERSGRMAADNALAASIEERGVKDFLTDWLSGPLFRNLSPEAADLPDRLRNTAVGLAASLRTAGTGVQAPLWGRLAALEMPVLVVAGADDTKFSEIGRRMADRIGTNAVFHTIEGAGHSAHLEQPDRFADLVEGFLAATGH